MYIPVIVTRRVPGLELSKLRTAISVQVHSPASQRLVSRSILLGCGSGDGELGRERIEGEDGQATELELA